MHARLEDDPHSHGFSHHPRRDVSDALLQHVERQSEDAPTCQVTIEDKVLFPSYLTDKGPISSSNILAVIRDQLCNSTECHAPIGIKPAAIVVAEDSEYDKCEISIGLTGEVEAYGYRQTEPGSDEMQDECAQSFTNMIQAIDGKVKECFWLGSHENQIYQTGFRALNPHNASALHISQGKTIPATLPSDSKAPVNNSTVQFHDSVFNTHSASTSKTPIYIGAVLGTIIFIVLTIVAVCCFKRRKVQKRKQRQRSGSGGQGKKKKKRRRQTNTNMSSTIVGSESGRSWNNGEQV